MSQPLRNELSNPGVFNSRLFNHDLFNLIKLNVWKFLGWNVQKCLATVCLYVHLLAIHIWMTPKSLLWWWWKVVMMSATSLMIWVCLWLSLMLLLLHGIVVPVLFTRNIIAFLWKSRRASPARLVFSPVFSKDYSRLWSWRLLSTLASS